jgi:hypothetical protein
MVWTILASLLVMGWLAVVLTAFCPLRALRRRITETVEE